MKINFFSCRGVTEAAGGAEEDQEGGIRQRDHSKFSSSMEQLLVVLCLFSVQPVPASIECVCLFAQFLSRSFKAVTSIQNYINGVHTLYALLDVPFPRTDNIELKLTVKGLKRLKPHTIRQAAPLSTQILHRVHGLLDLTAPFDATLWALLLLAFFTLSRKSNLVVTGQKAFDKNRQVWRSDVLIGERGLLVQFRWSKTNQFGSRVLLVPVLAIPGSVLCPLETYNYMLRLIPAKGDGPAFVLPVKGALVPVTYQVL